MLRQRSKHPFRRGAVPTVAAPTAAVLAQPPAAPPAPLSPPLSPSPKPSPRPPLSCLNVYESRIQTLERLLKVTETDLLTAEEERDCLLTQLAESQAHAAALQRDVLSLQLLRNELVLQRLDARDAADEQALRREVLEEELGRRERVLRKVREENRLLNRENERLRVELGVEERGKRREVRGRLLSKASREALRKASREALRQLGTVTPVTATETTEETESTPREGASRNSLLLWVEAYGSLVDHPDYRASVAESNKNSRPGTPSTPTTPMTPSSPTPTPTLRATTPRLPTPTLRPARSTFGRAPGSFRLRSGSGTPPPVPPVPPLAALLNGAAPITTPPTSGDDAPMPKVSKDQHVVNLNSPEAASVAASVKSDEADEASDEASVKSDESVHHLDQDLRRPSADRRSSIRTVSSDLSTAFFSSASGPPSQASHSDSPRPSMESVNSAASAGSAGSGSDASSTVEIVRATRPTELTLATAELSLPPRTEYAREVRREMREEEQTLDWPAWTAPRVLRPPPRPRRKARLETLTPVTEASSPETATPSIMPEQPVPEFPDPETLEIRVESEFSETEMPAQESLERQVEGRKEEPEPVQKLDWPAWSATSLTSTNSAHWDSSSSHLADVESAHDHESPMEGETEVDFSLIDPSHIALIEVSSDAGH